MSWNIHFALEWRDGGEIPMPCRRKAGRFLASRFRRAEHVGAVVLDPSEREPTSGWVQIRMRDGNEAAFGIVLGALQELAREEPRLRITAMDEFHLEGADVLELGEPRSVLHPDPTDGRGFYRADPGTEDEVHRAARARLDGPALARRFLETLTRDRLIEWNGSDEGVVKKLAMLVERIERGRWEGADAVLRALEADDAVEEIFATDADLDARWRAAINTGG